MKSEASLPTRERGLKSQNPACMVCAVIVAPYTGAWIEIIRRGIFDESMLSLPTRERGLK